MKENTAADLMMATGLGDGAIVRASNGDGVMIGRPLQ
jgi:hypothetical protein